MTLPRVDVEATGLRIDNLRLNAGMTVRDLQDAFGFECPQTIYKWIRGKGMPNLDNLIALAYIFHTTVDEIVAIEDE